VLHRVDGWSKNTIIMRERPFGGPAADISSHCRLNRCQYNIHGSYSWLQKIPELFQDFPRPQNHFPGPCHKTVMFKQHLLTIYTQHDSSIHTGVYVHHRDMVQKTAKKLHRCLAIYRTSRGPDSFSSTLTFPSGPSNGCVCACFRSWKFHKTQTKNSRGLSKMHGNPEQHAEVR